MPPSFSAAAVASRLQALLSPVLSQMALACGSPVAATKAAKISGLIHSLHFLDRLPLDNLNVVSIDVGIKNFSYCVSEKLDLTRSYASHDVLPIAKWGHYDLHARYGSTYENLTGDPNSPVDSKGYLSHLANHVVSEILVNSSPKPNLVVMETQRTRTRAQDATLPNVLLNYTLENMIYATYNCLQMNRAEKTVIVPMYSKNMVNYWLNRFFDKSSLRTSPSLTKRLRSQFFFNWVSSKSSPFAFPHLKLPKLDGLSNAKKSQAIAKVAANDGSMLAKKIDDLIDSLLYNLTMVNMLKCQRQLLEAVEKEADLNALLDAWLKYHVSLILPLMNGTDLKLNNTYDRFL